jgi:hypothetical protein
VTTGTAGALLAATAEPNQSYAMPNAGNINDDKASIE